MCAVKKMTRKNARTSAAKSLVRACRLVSLFFTVSSTLLTSFIFFACKSRVSTLLHGFYSRKAFLAHRVFHSASVVYGVFLSTPKNIPFSRRLFIALLMLGLLYPSSFTMSIERTRYTAKKLNAQNTAWFGDRKQTLRYDKKFLVADSLLPFDPGKMETSI